MVYINVFTTLTLFSKYFLGQSSMTLSLLRTRRKRSIILFSFSSYFCFISLAEQNIHSLKGILSVTGMEKSQQGPNQVSSKAEAVLSSSRFLKISIECCFFFLGHEPRNKRCNNLIHFQYCNVTLQQFHDWLIDNLITRVRLFV